MSVAERARSGFVAAFGVAPEGVAFVPGRVNLIGEHVDYNDGLVLPMPISAGTAIAWGKAEGSAIKAVALDFDCARDRFTPGAEPPHAMDDWRSYLRGTAHGLIQQGLEPKGTQLAIAGSISRGSGLSSSASLCVAVGRTLCPAASPEQLARAAQFAEHEWAGVRCGIMDQMAVAAGQAGAALLLDCADLGYRHVRLPDDWSVMIVQSGVRRGLVDGHYNRRRADCEAAATAMNLPSLRNATLPALKAAGLDPLIERRARHVIEEIARVGEAVAAIETRDLPQLGAMMRASHASLRDLFEVSEPCVDGLVELLNAAIGVRGGARMTGGGFGGAVVAVLPRSEVARVRAHLEQTYTPPNGAPLEILIEPTGQRAGECHEYA